MIVAQLRGETFVAISFNKDVCWRPTNYAGAVKAIIDIAEFLDYKDDNDINSYDAYNDACLNFPDEVRQRLKERCAPYLNDND